MKAIDPGEFKAEIQIISKTPTYNENGYPIYSETLVRRCRARFSRSSGTELIKANADFAEVKVRFLIRWSPTPIDRRMIVRYKDNDYEITYINDYGDSRQYVELWCTLLTQEGAT